MTELLFVEIELNLEAISRWLNESRKYRFRLYSPLDKQKTLSSFYYNNEKLKCREILELPS